jgi:hypothetical protein
MRILSVEEQDLCKRMLNGSGNNNYLGNLIYHRLAGISIAVQRSTKKVVLLYTTRNKMPTSDEQQKAIDNIGEIQVLILTTVNLIKLLEKEGYIMLIRRTTNVNDYSEFGQAVFNLPKISSYFADDKISELLIEYVDKEIYATEEFKVFCENNFIARDEQRYRTQIRRTTGILIVAISALLLNTGVFVYSIFKPYNYEKKVENLQQELKDLKVELNELKTKVPEDNKDV